MGTNSGKIIDLKKYKILVYRKHIRGKHSHTQSSHKRYFYDLDTSIYSIADTGIKPRREWSDGKGDGARN